MQRLAVCLKPEWLLLLADLSSSVKIPGEIVLLAGSVSYPRIDE
jgi:hypothetical protein